MGMKNDFEENSDPGDEQPLSPNNFSSIPTPFKFKTPPSPLSTRRMMELEAELKATNKLLDKLQNVPIIPPSTLTEGDEIRLRGKGVKW